MNTLLPPPVEEEIPLSYHRPRGMADGQAAFLCGLVGLVPGVGLVFGPLAFGLGLRELRTARQKPGTAPPRLAVAAIVLGVLALVAHAGLLAFALVHFGDQLTGL